MIRRFIFGMVISIGLLVVQSTWLSAIAILDVKPDLSLLFIVFLAFKNPSPQGQATGFLTGIFQDGMSASPLGLSAFIKTAVAWAFNLFSGKFYIDRIFIPFLFGFIATIAKALTNGFLVVLFSGRLSAYDPFSYRLWIEAAYNALAAPLLFLLLAPIERFLLPKEKHT